MRNEPRRFWRTNRVPGSCALGTLGEAITTFALDSPQPGGDQEHATLRRAATPDRGGKHPVGQKTSKVGIQGRSGIRTMNLHKLVIVAAFCVLSTAESRAQCEYSRYRWESVPTPTGPGPYGYCTVLGWRSGQVAPLCPSMTRILTDGYSCATNRQTTTIGTSPAYCPCDGGDQANALQAFPDDAIAGAYGCDAASCTALQLEGPESCTEEDPDQNPPFNEGCGNDEYGCGGAADGDGAPVRYTSGRVETKPITLFSVASPSHLSLSYTIQWGSHVTRSAARPAVIGGIQDSEPTIHHADETTHFLGHGWQDNLSDRLLIETRFKPSDVVAWQSINGTVTFSAANGWRSRGGKYELIDRGAPTDGFGRWMVRSTDLHAPRQVWVFEERSFTSYGGPHYKIARLRRRSTAGSAGADAVGRYGYTINWTSSGTISHVADTLGRQLVFNYYSSPAVGGIVRTRHLSSISYKVQSDAPAITVAAFQMTPELSRLDRVTSTDDTHYHRFLYWESPTPGCTRCWGMITDVLAPFSPPSTTPGVGAPRQAFEVAIEQNLYTPGLVGGTSYPSALGTYSKGSAREYAYEHRAERTTQFDLHQRGAQCAQNGTCSQGYACRAADQYCYVATITDYTANTRQSYNVGRASGGPNGGGTPTHSSAGSIRRTFNSLGAPTSGIDHTGIRTTYGYDSSGRVRCVVRGDDDEQAFAEPGNPNVSACAGPPSAHVIRTDFGALTVTRTTTSVLSGNATRTTQFDASSLLPISTRIEGKTRDLDGNTVPRSQTWTTSYDSLGRLVERNGPEPDSVSYDHETMSYYNIGDPSLATSPHNLGHRKTVTKYVGNSSAYTVLVTTYGEYDLFGVPHTQTMPSGDVIRTTPSSDRRTWALQLSGSDATTIFSINGDGSTRSRVDADGICTTYDYFDADNKYVGVPTKIRRSSSSDGCGSLPIDENSGEVQTFTFAAGEPDRMTGTTHKLNGAVQYSHSGVDYDTSRRLESISTLDSALPITFQYEELSSVGTTGPGGPTNGSWKTQTSLDALSRPAFIRRFVDQTNFQHHTYTYALPQSMHPNAITRGYNSTAVTTVNLVWDDFGQLVETSIPEDGPAGNATRTRYEYNLSGYVSKRRLAVGTTAQNTTAYGYDSAGRRLFADHDQEHPPNCNSMTVGAPIGDFEYKYDDCAASQLPQGFSCTRATGRLATVYSVLHCGSSSQIVRRGQWYSYSAAGIDKIAYATRIGTSTGVPAVAAYGYTAAGRPQFQTSPLNTAFGTRYERSASTGEIAAVRTSAGASIAANISYRAFGPLSHVDTPVLLQGSTTRRLTLQNTYRQDLSLSTLDWSLVRVGGAQLGPISLIKQAFTYSPEGLIRSRTDSADQYSSRLYTYDSLLRLKCEARGDGAPPTAADCASATPRTVALASFGNGESATSPQDVRRSVVLRSDTVGSTCDPSDPCYVSPSAETYGYVSGSGQVQSISRLGSVLSFHHDAVGRRSFEFDSADPVRSRRDYTYLPNGHLASVTGKRADGSDYHVTIRYDHDGNPATISDGDFYELFWDAAGRLTAAEITPTGTNRPARIRWHYHYLGSLLVAATRELVTDSGTTVKMFWAATDERGFIYRLVDDQGLTHWAARWDASGWRRVLGSRPEMWIPFGMSGQVILASVYDQDGPRGGTDAHTATGTGYITRPSIILNQARAYDPMTGSFLQPDPADRAGRRMPEGYAYARWNPLEGRDPDGRSSAVPFPTKLSYLFDKSCGSRSPNITAALTSAMLDIWSCTTHLCADAVIKRQILAALSTGTYYCVSANSADPDAVTLFDDVTQSVLIPGTYPFAYDAKMRTPFQATEKGSLGYALYSTRRDRSWYTPAWRRSWAMSNTRETDGANLDARKTILPPNDESCLKQTLAHEAIHGAFKTMSALTPANVVDPNFRRSSYDVLKSVMDYHTEERWITEDPGGFGRSFVDECVDCNTGFNFSVPSP